MVVVPGCATTAAYVLVVGSSSLSEVDMGPWPAGPSGAYWSSWRKLILKT